MGLNISLPFHACQRESCVNVTIINDDVLEDARSFFITLESDNLTSRINLSPNYGEIRIIDDGS